MVKRLLYLVIYIYLHTLSLNAQCPPPGGAVFINEMKASGLQEYIELVVIGDEANPTNPVDLTGWIVDDNNIDMAGNGTADGHLVFTNTYNSVLPGAIIVIYSTSFPYAPLPASNPPYLYVIPDTDMDACSNLPNFTNSSYTPCTGSVGDWGFIGLRTAGDLTQVREPNASFFHGLKYGTATVIVPTLDVSNGDIGLDCGDWFDASNYTILSQTPGDFNSTDNENLILSIRAGTMDCNNIDPSCSPPPTCPEINGITIPISVCENEEFVVTATNIANMDLATNGEANFGVNFLSFPGAAPPLDPYVGGTSIGTVGFAGLMGVDPNQSAELTVPTNTMIPGVYNVCAILDPIPTAIICNPFQCVQIEILEVPVVELSGTHNFCPGDCYDLEVSISGGTEPWDVDFELTIGSLPSFHLTQTSYDINNQVTICYDAGGFIPFFEDPANTWHIPIIITGSGTLEVLEVRAADGCKATITDGTLTILFHPKPNASTPSSFELCDDVPYDGFMTIDLTTKDSEVNGGSGEEVRYYEDMTLLSQIIPANSYFTDSKTIYAVVVSNEGCISDPVPLIIDILPAGDEGLINIFCNTSGTKECDFCTTDAVAIDILIELQNTIGSYTIEMEYGNISSGFTPFTASNVHSGDVFPFSVTESVEFHLLSVTILGGCPDEIDLGDPVIITITAGPEINMPLFQNGCDSVILASPILGTNLTGNESYYTMSGGNGTAIAPGTVFYTPTTLYIYDSNNGCSDEIMIELNIVNQVSFTPIDDVDQCGAYQLPEILGIGLTGAEAYFTMPNGNGTMYTEGDIITSSIHLYVYDPVSCLEGEIDFSITLGNGPIILSPSDTTVCDTFILLTIQGTGFDGSEFYNTEFNATGDTLLPGDTIITNQNPQTIYIYAAGNGTCISQDSFIVNMIPSTNVGQNATLIICEGDTEPINLWENLGINIDTAGKWTDHFNIGVDLSDSTSVDFSDIPAGNYLFKYQLIDTTCGISIAQISISIVGNPNAGQSNNISLCQSDSIAYNLESFLGTFDFGGIWTQSPSGTFDLSDINSVYLNTVGAGMYQIKYIIDAGANCQADTATLSINLKETVFAGNDTLITVCTGTIVDLSNLVSSDASSIESFIDDDTTSSLVGSIFTSTGLPSGIYHFTHKVDAISPCPEDNAILTVELVDGLTAGTDNSTTLCVGDQLDLTTLLVGADTGGSFFDNSNTGFLNGNTVTIANDNISSIDFIYTVGGGNCPISTSIVTINIDSQPSISWSIDNPGICEDECSYLTVNMVGVGPFDVTIELLKNNIAVFDNDKHTSSTSIGYYICNSSVTEISGDSIKINGDFTWQLNVTSYNDVNCLSDISITNSIDITILENESIVIDTTSCLPVIIEGITFDQNHTTDHFEVDDPLACKKVYDVVYNYLEPEFTYIPEDPICPDDLGAVSITSINGTPSDFSMVIDDVELPISSLPYSINIPIGNHEIYILQNSGCESPIQTFEILEAGSFNFTSTLDSLNSHQVQFKGIVDIVDYTVIWTPSDSLSCNSCLDPIINLGTDPASYELEIRYSADCIYTYILNVPGVKIPEPEPEEINTIYIPNVFNPEHEPFYISTTEVVNIDLFQIFDRWGNLMYDSKNQDSNTGIGWDGLFKGTEVLPGVYVYAVQLTINGNKKHITGPLTLLR